MFSVACVGTMACMENSGFIFLRFSVIQLFAFRFDRGFLKLYYVKDGRL